MTTAAQARSRNLAPTRLIVHLQVGKLGRISPNSWLLRSDFGPDPYRL
jgi:hypothetical protein